MENVTVDPDDVRAVVGGFTYFRHAVGPVASFVPGIDDVIAAASRLMHAVAGEAMPDSPVSSMSVAAISVDEVRRAYEGAGFTRDEAFELTKIHVNASATAQAFRSPGG